MNFNRLNITISDKMLIEGLYAKEDIEEIKFLLTFPNPAHEKALKYSRYNYVTIPKKLEYFREHKKFKGFVDLEVPRGFPVCEVLGGSYDLNITYDVCCTEVSYPKFRMKLREDQRSAYDSFTRVKRDRGLPKRNTMALDGVISLPTGKGKTILALYFAQKYRCKTLVLVHKNDLVTGWQKDIEQCFGGEVVPGLIKAKSRTVGEQITISTVQTLSRMSEDELERYRRMFSLVILDEAHHIGANTFNILNKFNSRYRMGLSATPKRQDGLTHVLNLYLGGVVHNAKHSREDKDILPVDVVVRDSKVRFRPFLEMDGKGNIYDQVFNRYDFTNDEMPEHWIFLEEIPFKERPNVPYQYLDDYVLTHPHYKIPVCRDILKSAREGKSVLCLFRQKSHIDMYYNYLKRKFPAEKIYRYYGDSKEDFKDVRESLERREILITLSTLAKSTEGTNVKAWEELFLISSINSMKDVEQAVGRIRRVTEGNSDVALVHDYTVPEVYSMKHHITNRMKAYFKLKCEVRDYPVRRI